MTQYVHCASSYHFLSSLINSITVSLCAYNCSRRFAAQLEHYFSCSAPRTIQLRSLIVSPCPFLKTPTPNARSESAILRLVECLGIVAPEPPVSTIPIDTPSISPRIRVTRKCHQNNNPNLLRVRKKCKGRDVHRGMGSRHYIVHRIRRRTKGPDRMSVAPLGSFCCTDNPSKAKSINTLRVRRRTKGPDCASAAPLVSDTHSAAKAKHFSAKMLNFCCRGPSDAVRESPTIVEPGEDPGFKLA